MHPPLGAEKAVRKYLGDHAEAESRSHLGIARAAPVYGHGLVIPCHGEGGGILGALRTIPTGSHGPVLVLVVLNACQDAPRWIHRANAETLEKIRAEYGEPESPLPDTFVHRHPAGSIGVVDRATRSFLPPGQGVGLARKIGADLLLALQSTGRVNSPWIHCSDADASFPADYFEQSERRGANPAAALIYRFRHQRASDPREQEAALQYEISLRYYVMGLRFATSPYAFHSIGSTMAVHASAYAAVRGFPRRRAAEDFYLLNKIAKVGRIESLSGDPLHLSPRPSSRVPFGTGATVRRLLEAPVPQLDFYDPKVFSHLRAWLRVLPRLKNHRAPMRELPSLLREEAQHAPDVQAERLVDALECSGARKAAESAFAAAPGLVDRRLHEAFDGFRTLKLIHTLRDQGLASLPMREALGRACFVSMPAARSAPTAELAAHFEAQDYASP